jgi:hypothetical protein
VRLQKEIDKERPGQTGAQGVKDEDEEWLGLKIGPIVGIALGALGVLLLIILATMLLMCHRRHHKPKVELHTWC